ncbi:protein FRIGIDA-like [Solanum dulcamara]|uniref:protein FRIGIDA-like n=1 Tax=Solanum dulcamara TaxID=45834 RepID=UPI002485C101|nr:protein FRIGIDA-like [Solanum dulcamara]
MVEPADTATAAPPPSQTSPAVEAQSQLLEKVNVLQNIIKQSEFLQPPIDNDSIANFRKLSDAFSAFQVCFAELQKHVDSIGTLIVSMRPPETTKTTPLSVSSLPAAAAPTPAPEPEAEPSSEFDPSEEEVEVKSPGSELKSTRSELESLCERMDGRGLRKYMITHLSDINVLVEEVPKALKLSPNPARLVLDCVGKFYLQGSRAYVKGSPAVNGRKASVLVLECFLLMGINEGVEIEKGVKEEAEKAALAWRKRLIAEGGVQKAFDMDARGLLLLIGCFGIPGEFRNEDIRDLLLASPFKKNMSGALTRSNGFMAKITEIVEGMVNQKMEIEAVDIAYTFGIEDRFNPQKLVTSFLRESKEPLKKMKGKSQGSLAAVNEAKKKHLTALRSVIKCSKRHSIDLSKLLPGWQINEQIMSLEKEIAVGEKKMVQKRKIDETESSGRISNKEAKQSHFPNPRLQQERIVNHIDSNTTLLEGGTAGHMYGYSLSPSVLHGPGGHGKTLVDNTPMQIGSHTGQLYGLHGDVAVYDRFPSHSYTYGPSSYLAGSTSLPNTKSGDAYRPPPYLESSRGLPKAIPTDVAGRSSASDLFQFDNTVTTSELYRSSGLRAVDVVPSVASAHHSSYLYTGPDSFALSRRYLQP